MPTIPTANDPLPVGATLYSQQRLALARDLLAARAELPALEVALSGSAARGVADSYSDVELNFWGAGLPDIAARRTWLLGQGASELDLANEQTPDGTTWDRWRWRDVWFEAGWQAIPSLEANLRAICAATVLEPGRLVLAEVVANAIILRTDGRLSVWQGWLAHYPAQLADNLIADALQRWLSPYTTVTRWATVRRDQPLALTQQLVGDICAMLRILFALNQQWEPDFKWLAPLSNRLSNKPARLVERIADIFYLPDAAARMEVCADLLLDTLDLLPGSEAVMRAREVLRGHPGE